MTKVLEMTFLIHLLVLHLTPTVFSSSHYGRAQKVKHYAGGTSYHHPTDVVATSHPTDAILHAGSARQRKVEHLDNVSSNLYAMIDNPAMSEEYLDRSDVQ